MSSRISPLKKTSSTSATSLSIYDGIETILPKGSVPDGNVRRAKTNSLVLYV